LLSVQRFSMKRYKPLIYSAAVLYNHQVAKQVWGIFLVEKGNLLSIWGMIAVNDTRQLCTGARGIN